MSSPTMTPRRIVALLLTAVAITGLAFMRAGRDPDPVHCAEVSAAIKKPRDLLGGAATREIREASRDCGRPEALWEAEAPERVIEDMPDSWMGLPIHPGNVRLAARLTSVGAPLNGAGAQAAWAAADRGDASGLWVQSVLAHVFLPEEPAWGDEPVAAGARSGFTQTMLAKIIFGVFVGLPIVGLIASVAIARRTRRRGRLGVLASATVRTAFAAVLGLAGWTAAVMAVLYTSAPIAFDDPTLVMVALAFPVAAAVHLGWLDRRRPRQTRTIALAAAAAGAIIGARLGYGVAADFAELWTAIVGAVVGANLAVIARDVWAGDDPAPLARGR